MLHSLTIDNVVLIEHQVLELGPGFNVLTGETGAGKSMVVDAIALVLGGRAQPQVVRTGEREAEVAALFEVESGSRVAAKLEAAGVPCDGGQILGTWQSGSSTSLAWKRVGVSPRGRLRYMAGAASSQRASSANSSGDLAASRLALIQCSTARGEQLKR
ncbi:AAA family ATPase [Salmonella enterica]|uniref:DNA repair protein RecN n=1 Tax=Salmonella enterica subsp. enterica serovar Dessau TaxID=2564349 RepID=A0A8E5IMN8_SALET|nr:AAA family ATPase [Salmonella enterica]QUS47119.1 AAA family ATPase [Salmonella enterica subsp. enterica serovar Dessau]